MHPALEIQEILLNIFYYCCPPLLSQRRRKRVTPDLVALASTCRAFKDPALDVLWRVLFDWSPLARCLPEASYQAPSGNKYAFSRSLTHAEWDILRSYARRVRSIRHVTAGLDWNSVDAFLNPGPPTTAPLFPNLRSMNCVFANGSLPLLRLPFPSLLEVDVAFDPATFQDSVKSFLGLCPNIRVLTIHVWDTLDKVHKIEPDHLCHLQRLRSVYSPQLSLDMDGFVQLSCMPLLTQLTCAISATSPPPTSSHRFPYLRSLRLYSKILLPLSRFLFQMRLPAVTSFEGCIDRCFSKQDLSLFMAAVHTFGDSRTMLNFGLDQYSSGPDYGSDVPLDIEDFRPCIAFTNLRHIKMDIQCDVELTDSQLLELTSAWPKLEHLRINDDYGWNALGGITPGGLVRLLQTSKLLTEVTISLDTREYTQVPPSQAPPILELTLQPDLLIDVLDASIEVECVPAVAAFLSGLSICSGSVISLRAWDGARMTEVPEYVERWDEVRRLVNDKLGRPPKSEDSDGET